MKRITNLFFALAVLLGAAAAASAQDAPPGVPGGVPGSIPGGRFQMPQFKDMDKNKDGKISKDEWPSQMPQQFFDRLDANRPVPP